jgi:outer membrane protein
VERDNPALIAATFASRAATEEVRKQSAGHQPTLDLTASYGRTEQSVGTTPSDRGYANTQASLGLQLTIPIYSGGSQSAKVREAIALQDKAAQDLETVRRGVRSTSRQAWFGIQSGLARQKAAAQAVRSARAAIRLATLAKQRELKTELDVLQATQQLHLAQRDLQGAAYLVLLNKFKLRAAAGQLTWAEVDALDAAFVPSVRGLEARAAQAAGNGP